MKLYRRRQTIAFVLIATLLAGNAAVSNAKLPCAKDAGECSDQDRMKRHAHDNPWAADGGTKRQPATPPSPPPPRPKHSDRVLREET